MPKPNRKPDYVSSATSTLANSEPRKDRFPKPIRLNVAARVITQLHKELKSVPDVREAIRVKDARTVQSYVEVLARLKGALADLEEMTDILQAVLLGRDGLVKLDKVHPADRDKQLASLWDEGKSAKEIAQLLDMHEYSVRNRLSHLRKAGHKIRRGRGGSAAATGEPT